MTHCWNESEKGKPKYSQTYLSHCHLDGPSTETGLPRNEAGD